MFTKDVYEKGLTLAKEFYSYTGNLDIGSGLVYKDYNLGEFLRLCIESYQEDRLPFEIIEELNTLGVDLEKALPEKEAIYYKISEDFLIGYQKAKRYYEEHGDICLNAYDQNNPDLGSFLSSQRKRYSLNAICNYEVDLLDSLDMLWDDAFKDIIWYKGYCKVRRLYREKKEIDSGDEEYKWLLMNKIAYLEHSLQKKQIEFLKKIRIDEFKEECSIDELKWQYNYLTGKTAYIIKDKTSDDDLDLSQQYKKEKIKRAEWDTWLRMLSDYMAKNGSLPKQDDKTEDGYGLGAWLNVQKAAYNKGELSVEKIIKLKSLGISLEYTKKVVPWEATYREAQEYYLLHNNLDIPSDYRTKEGVLLKNWVYNQRYKYRNGTISQERVNKLREIGLFDANDNNRDFTFQKQEKKDDRNELTSKPDIPIHNEPKPFLVAEKDEDLRDIASISNELELGSSAKIDPEEEHPEGSAVPQRVERKPKGLIGILKGLLK